MIKLAEATKTIIKSAIKKLAGVKRRIYLAEVTETYCEGNARAAELVFGSGRQTIIKGQKERASGIECLGAYSLRGNKKAEVRHPKLSADIIELAMPHSQVDPQFKGAFHYTRLTPKALREELIKSKGWLDKDLPTVRSFNDILNRLGFRLRRVQKRLPEKKRLRLTPFLPTST